MSLWSLINFGNAAFIVVVFLVLSLKKPIWKIGVILAAALLLKFRPGIDLDNLIFIFSVLGVLFLSKVLPFRPQANALIAVIAGLIVFNIGLIFL